MSKFSQGFRSFIEGLDWKLIWAYSKAVREHGWEILWGAGMVGVPFGILTLYYAPSRSLLGWLFVWIVLVAGYFVWRADHVRLQQKICVTKVLDQKWWHADFNRDAIAYYFEIANKSEALSIHGVRVQLEKIEPEVENLNWLPIPLHQKHDNPVLGQPHVPAREFSLNPSEHKHIDFISALVGGNHFEVEHVAGIGVNRNVPVVGQGHHRLRVTVTAQDMPILYAWFDVWMNEAGVLMCEMESDGNQTK